MPSSHEPGDPFGQWVGCPSDWQRVVLWDLAEYINGRAFRPSDLSLTGLSVIKITELKYGISNDTGQYDGPFEDKHVLKDDDLLFAWSGNPETSLDVFWWRGGTALVNQHIFRVIPRDGLNKRYLYYLLKFLRPTFIRTARDKATSMGHVKVSDLQRLIAHVPPVCEQEAIAGILRCLDDKIELNRRMNETLEATARTIFKSWFVDFDPVRARAEGHQPFGMDAETAALFPDSFENPTLGKVPKGWRTCAVGDVIEVGGGSTPSTKKSAYWDGEIHWATPKDLSDLQAPVLLDTERRITQAGVEQIGSRVYPEGTVLLSSRAPIGYLAITEVATAVNQGMVAMVCARNPTSHYMLHWTRANMDSVESRASGTTFQEISKSNFRSIPLAVPTDTVMRAFSERVEPLHRQIVLNVRQSRTLAAIRDTLLPKLISGAIRVKECAAVEADG